jgi:HSP20 family protein
MSQLVRFNTPTSLRSVFETLWGNDLIDDNLLKQAKMPAVNVKDNEKNYEIEVAAPGMKKEDFDLSVENRILIITGETKEEKEVNDDTYTRREFASTSFTRSFSLPENADENNIQAHYEDGILRVTVPKVQEKKPQKKVISLT